MCKFYELSKKINDECYIKCRVPLMKFGKGEMRIETIKGWCKFVDGIPCFVQKNADKSYQGNVYGYICTDKFGSPEEAAAQIERFVSRNKHFIKQFVILFRFVNTSPDGAVGKDEYFKTSLEAAKKYPVYPKKEE